MSVPNTPLFVKTHDFNVWLLNHTQRFPKNLRQSYTQRLESLAFEFEELLLMANTSRGTDRQHLLSLADGKLLCLRALLRYTQDFQLWSSGQVHYAAKSVDELGRLLGAWQKKGTGR